MFEKQRVNPKADTSDPKNFLRGGTRSKSLNLNQAPSFPTPKTSSKVTRDLFIGSDVAEISHKNSHSSAILPRMAESP